MSQYTCTIERDQAGAFVATCVEMDLSADGPTEREAIDQLKRAIEENMNPEAVAPPSHPDISAVELVVVGQGSARGSGSRS